MKDRLMNGRSVVARSVLGALFFCLSCGGSDKPVGPKGPSEDVATVTVTPGSPTVAVRSITALTVTAKNAEGTELTGRTATWTTSDTNVARVNTDGSMAAVGAGTATITATVGGKSATAAVTVTQGAMPLRGVYMQFERRNWPSGWYSGDILDSLNTVDPSIGQTVSSEVIAQLEAIKTMGANTITFELRATDAVRDPAKEGYPDCNTGPSLGVLFPQPETRKLDNLVALFDIAQARGIKILLRLVNRHFEASYRPDSETWLLAILNRVKSHPALELVLFEGDAKHVDSNGDGTLDKCGGQAEPALWLGPSSYAAEYLQWAFQLGKTAGLPWRKISAQATVGSYQIESGAGAGPAATDRHLWHTPGVEKTIFDRLSVPDAERTYALSLYEGTKCRFANGLSCTDASAAEWADQMMRKVWSTVGERSRARVVAVEFGTFDPVVAGWGTEEALEHAVGVLRKYGVEGGSFWRWTNFTNAEEADATIGHPLKKRGMAYSYFPAKDVLERVYKTP
jgi:hypothetical protein